MAKMARMKLHLFRQDLSAKLKADFQQDYQDFFCFSISILFILLILSEK